MKHIRCRRCNVSHRVEKSRSKPSVPCETCGLPFWHAAHDAPKGERPFVVMGVKPIHLKQWLQSGAIMEEDDE